MCKEEWGFPEDFGAADSQGVFQPSGDQVSDNGCRGKAAASPRSSFQIFMTDQKSPSVVD